MTDRQTTPPSLTKLLATVTRVEQSEDHALQDEATAMNAVLTILARQQRALVAPQDMKAMHAITRTLQAIPAPGAYDIAPIVNTDRFDESKVLSGIASAIADTDKEAAA